MIPVYTGSVTHAIYNNVTFDTCQNPPARFDVYNPLVFQPIKWTTPVPDASYNNILSLQNTPGIKVTYDTYITVTGMQDYDCSSTVYTGMTLTDPYGHEYSVQYNVFQSGLHGGTAVYNIIRGAVPPSTVPAPIPQPFNIPVIVTIYVCNQVCARHDVRNYNISLDVVITATTLCSGTNLSTTVCQNFCSLHTDVCFGSYLSYCFPDRIGSVTDDSCRKFFSTYLATQRNDVVDKPIQQYCRAKYKSFDQLFNPRTAGSDAEKQREIDADICACNLDDPLYDKYIQDIAAKYPGFGAFGIKPRCSLSQCVGSRFPNVSVPVGGCKIPCISVIIFENNGTITDGNIIFNQSGNCAGPNGSDPDTSSIWIFAILAVIIIVIVIIAYYYSRNNVSQRPQQTQSRTRRPAGI